MVFRSRSNPKLPPDLLRKNSAQQSCLQLACLGGHYDASQTLIIAMSDAAVIVTPPSTPTTPATSTPTSTTSSPADVTLNSTTHISSTFDIDQTDAKSRSCLHSACQGGLVEFGVYMVLIVPYK